MLVQNIECNYENGFDFVQDYKVLDMQIPFS